MKRIVLSLWISVAALGLYAQDVPDIKLDQWFCCDLHDTFQAITEKHQIKFEYDVALFQSIKSNDHPRKMPLKRFLDLVCKREKMKYFVEKDGVVHIVDRWYKRENATLSTKKSYTGAAKRKNFTLSGKVIDKESQESLPYVTIAVKGSGRGTTSNVDGFFSLMNVPTDTATVLFSFIGYLPKLIYLTPETKLSGLEIELEKTTVNLNEVVVEAEKYEVLQVSGEQVGMMKMSPHKLDGLPNLGEKDILRTFQLMPGISAANENSSGLYVRGGTPDQSLVLYDGFTVYNVEHLFGFFSTFNSNAIKSVRLYKGGFDAQYGGRLSSVVDITGKDGDRKAFNMAADLSLMSINGFVEFPIGQKVSFITAARRSWSSPLYDKIFEQFTEDNDQAQGMGGRFGNTTQEVASYFYDINSKLTYKPTDNDELSLSFYNGMDDLDNSVSPQMTGFGGPMGGGPMNIDLSTTDLTNWGNTGASLKWSHRFNDRWFMNSLVSYSNYFSLRERSTAGGFSRGDDDETSISRGVNENNNLQDFSAKLDWEYQLNQNNRLGFGVQGTYNDIDYTYTQNDTVDVIDRSMTGSLLSAYAQDQMKWFDEKFEVTPGIRFTHFSETNKAYFEPRLNMVYNLNKKWKLKASAGSYYQFAKRVIREDISSGSRDFWVLSDNDQLPVSQSLQFVAGAAYENKNYLFDVEAYFKKLDNVTEYSLRIETEPGGVDYSENFFTGTGMVRGIDFLAQKKYGNWNGWLGYTLGQVTSHIDEFGDYDFYAANDVTHEFKTVLSYKYRNWDFGASWIFASGRPYTAPEGGYELTLLDGTTADYINVSVKNGNRLPSYHRLDVSAKYNFLFGGSAPASIGVSVFNAYNRANVWYNEYEIVDSEVIETPVNYLGITPNLTLSIRLR